eukprot:g1926.t1
MIRRLFVSSSLRWGTRSIQSAADAAKEVSYARALFFGVNNEHQCFPYPGPTEEERDLITALVDPVEKFFAEEIDSKLMDETKTIPDETLDALKAMGLFGLQIDEDLDGLGLSNTGYARVCEEISVDASLAVTVMAHQSIGLKGILLNGNEEQKRKYLPKLATGEEMAAFALTEPTSGSDAQSIRTRATLSEDGSHFLLNGGKIWISNGGWADVMTVFAQVEMPDGKDKVTAFIVERAFGGVTSGPPEDKLGIRASNTCEVVFENCPVPVANVLGGGEDGKEGGQAGVGQGFKVAMNILNNGRFGIGAATAAMMRKTLSACAEHALQRKQFGSSLSSFGLIQEKFATTAANTYANESLAYMTTGMIDRGDPSCEVEAAVCKVFGSEKSFEAINEAIQIMGGMGFMKDYPFERTMRDCRILSIFEGTNEILRLLIALTGIKAAGDRLKELGKMAKNPLADPFGLLSEVGGRVQNRLSPGAVAAVHPDLAKYSTNLRRDTVQFGGAVEGLLVKHGKDIVQEQLQLKRVADCVIDLYATSACLSRASKALEKGSSTADHEAKLAAHFAAGASLRIQQNLKEIGGYASSHDDRVESIAKDIFDSGHYLPHHPVVA